MENEVDQEIDDPCDDSKIVCCLNAVLPALAFKAKAAFFVRVDPDQDTQPEISYYLVLAQEAWSMMHVSDVICRVRDNLFSLAGKVRMRTCS
jgi:hypothetical protein